MLWSRRAMKFFILTLCEHLIPNFKIPSTFNTKFLPNQTSNMAQIWLKYGSGSRFFSKHTEDGVLMPSGNMYLGTLYIYTEF
jgi:hypothetical protein